MRLIVSEEAIADLNRLREFLVDKEAQAARRAIAVLDDAIRSLEFFPGRGRQSGIPGVRELIVPFGSSAYLIRYALSPELEKLIVIRVWHGREARE